MIKIIFFFKCLIQLKLCKKGFFKNVIIFEIVSVV